MTIQTKKISFLLSETETSEQLLSFLPSEATLKKTFFLGIKPLFIDRQKTFPINPVLLKRANEVLQSEETDVYWTGGLTSLEWNNLLSPPSWISLNSLLHQEAKNFVKSLKTNSLSSKDNLILNNLYKFINSFAENEFPLLSYIQRKQACIDISKILLSSYVEQHIKSQAKFLNGPAYFGGEYFLCLIALNLFPTKN